MMKNFFQKQREAVAILAYVGIIFGLVYLVILPLMARIDGMNNQIQEEAMKREIVKQHIGELPKIQKQYEILQDGGDLNDVLLDKNKAVVLIERLEKMAEENGSTIAIEVQDASDSKKVDAVKGVLMSDLPSTDFLKFKITLSGKYASVVGFIESLESFEYYADITAIQISHAEIKNTTASSQGSMNVGSLNPFALGATTDTTKTVKVESDLLTASLDTVFYVKQK